MRDPVLAAAPRSRRTGPTATARRSSTGETCHEHRPRRSRPRLRARRAATSPTRTTGRCSSPTTPATASGSMRRGRERLPDPATVQNFAQGAPTPVDLEFGPTGELYYADITGELDPADQLHGRPATTRRPRSPQADPQSGDVPLTVDFDADRVERSQSPATCSPTAWDLDGDGQLDDSTAAHAELHLQRPPGRYTVTLRVTDTSGAFDEDTVTINAGSGPPVAEHQHPGRRHDLGRRPDDRLHRLRPPIRSDGTLPGSALDWQLIIHHCTTPSELPRASHPGLSRTPPAARSSRRTTSTRRPGAAADRDGLGREHRHDDAPARPADGAAHRAANPAGLDVVVGDESGPARSPRR